MNLSFKKYIISIDLGSTMIKYLIMDTSSDDFKIFAIDSKSDYDIHKVFEYIINKYNISLSDIEALIFTGARSSFINNDDYYNVNVFQVSEFTSASYGALLLSNIEKGIIINLGTGTSFLYSDLNTIRHIGGTAIGGGTIMSLVKILYKIEKYDDLIDFIKNGNNNNVDLNIGDISNTNIGDMNKNTTASNLGAIINNTKEYNDNDVVAGIVNLVIQNIGLLIKETKKNLENELNENNIPCILIGGLITSDYIKKYFDKIGDYINVKFKYTNYSDYAVCIGAYEYYILKLKNE